MKNTRQLKTLRSSPQSKKSLQKRADQRCTRPQNVTRLSIQYAIQFVPWRVVTSQSIPVQIQQMRLKMSSSVCGRCKTSRLRPPIEKLRSQRQCLWEWDRSFSMDWRSLLVLQRPHTDTSVWHDA